MNMFSFLNNPKWLFVIDGLGGLLTFLMYGFILPQFSAYFFLPPSIMSTFSWIGLGYAIFSLLCSKLHTLASSKLTARMLQFIAIANVLFCVLSLSVLISQFEGLSRFDIAYLLYEKLVILTLVAAEVRLSFVLEKSKRQT